MEGKNIISIQIDTWLFDKVNAMSNDLEMTINELIVSELEDSVLMHDVHKSIKKILDPKSRVLR